MRSGQRQESVSGSKVPNCRHSSDQNGGPLYSLHVNVTRSLGPSHVATLLSHRLTWVSYLNLMPIPSHPGQPPSRIQRSCVSCGIGQCTGNGKLGGRVGSEMTQRGCCEAFEPRPPSFGCHSLGDTAWQVCSQLQLSLEEWQNCSRE